MKKVLAVAVATLGVSAAVAQLHTPPFVPSADSKPRVLRAEEQTPEQRENFRRALEQRREERRKQWEAMTPEQRAEIKARIEKRREEIKRRWDAATPEERERMPEFRYMVERRRAEAAGKPAAVAK